MNSFNEICHTFFLTFDFQNPSKPKTTTKKLVAITSLFCGPGRGTLMLFLSWTGHTDCFSVITLCDTCSHLDCFWTRFLFSLGQKIELKWLPSLLCCKNCWQGKPVVTGFSLFLIGEAGQGRGWWPCRLVWGDTAVAIFSQQSTLLCLRLSVVRGVLKLDVRKGPEAWSRQCPALSHWGMALVSSVPSP